MYSLFTTNMSTHKNSCDLGSVGTVASGTVRRLWIQTVGWCVVVSCACELITTLSVVFFACSQQCVNFQFRFVVKWTHNKWRPVESDRYMCFWLALPIWFFFGKVSPYMMDPKEGDKVKAIPVSRWQYLLITEFYSNRRCLINTRTSKIDRKSVV